MIKIVSEFCTKVKGVLLELFGIMKYEDIIYLIQLDITKVTIDQKKNLEKQKNILIDRNNRLTYNDKSI